MKTIYGSALLLSLLLICSACGDDDAKLICENGLEEINGSCVCPSGKILIRNTCRALSENEYWMVMPDEYPCKDTIFMEIVSIDTIAEAIDIKLIILAESPVSPITYGNGIIYFENNTNRKEFNAENLVPYCEINGTYTDSHWKGKFINDTEIYVKMYHRNIHNVYDIKDSTEVIFSREVP